VANIGYFPTAVTPEKVTVIRRRSQAMASSPFTYKQQVCGHQGKHWEILIQMPPMSAANGATFQTFAENLNGNEHTFQFDMETYVPGQANMDPITFRLVKPEQAWEIDVNNHWHFTFHAISAFCGEWSGSGYPTSCSSARELNPNLTDADLLWVWDFDFGLRTEQAGHYNRLQNYGWLAGRYQGVEKGADLPAVGGYSDEDFFLVKLAGTSHAITWAKGDICVRKTGAWTKASRSNLRLVSDEYRGPGGRSLRINYELVSGGYCGAWVDLYDTDSGSPTYLDTTGFTHLSFWVKGAAGGEQIYPALADSYWLGIEDSLNPKVGGAGADQEIADYLGGSGITTSWQECVIPLADYNYGGNPVDATDLAQLVLKVAAASTGTIYLDDVCFKDAAGEAVANSTTLSNIANTRPLKKAMWVWNTLNQSAFSITSYHFSQEWFQIAGNHVNKFREGHWFNVSGSNGGVNDGAYTCERTAIFTGGNTRIYPDQNVGDTGGAPFGQIDYESNIQSSTERTLLKDFSLAKGINTLFLQVPGSFGGTNDYTMSVQQESDLRDFVELAKQNSIDCYALEGNRFYGTEPFHTRMHSFAQWIVDFNAASVAASRPDAIFFGVRFDNEPYLIEGTTSASSEWTDLGTEAIGFYEITSVDTANEKFFISGDKTNVFTATVPFTVVDSTGNDGSYTCNGNSIYTSGSDVTIITVNENITDATVDGEIETAGWPYQESQLDFTNSAEQQIMLAELAELLDYIKTNILEGNNLKLGVDLPFWYDQGSTTETGEPESPGVLTPPISFTYNGVSKIATRHYYSICDNIAIMAYRDRVGDADGSVRHALDEIAWGNVACKQCFVGIETQAVDGVDGSYSWDEPPKISYYGRSESFLDDEIAMLEAEFIDCSSYAGIALHYFEAFRDFTEY